MFPVYSVTYVPGPYPVLRSLGLLDVLQGVRLRGPRSQALPGRRLRRLAPPRREKCGLGTKLHSKDFLESFHQGRAKGLKGNSMSGPFRDRYHLAS